MNYLSAEHAAWLMYNYAMFKYMVLNYLVPYALTYFIHASLLAGIVLVPLGLAVLAGQGQKTLRLQSIVHSAVIPLALTVGLITTLYCGPKERYGIKPTVSKEELVSQLEKTKILKTKNEDRCCCEK